jgi:alpha-tubulin suppressor-like RCC1 family protein
MTLLSPPSGIPRTLGVVALFLGAGGLGLFACSPKSLDDGTGSTQPHRVEGDDDGDDDDDSGTSGELPTPIDGGKLEISRITAGKYHTCVLWNDGILKCWGKNESGELGLGDAASRGLTADTMGKKLPPVNLGNGARTKVVGAGGYRTCAILADGTVRCWGANLIGGLGQPDDDNRGDTPETIGDNLAAVDLGTGRLAKDLGVGDFSTCALLTDGTVKCWGSNLGGELGYGDAFQRGGAPSEYSRPMGNDLPPVDIGLSGIVKIGMTSADVSQTGCAVSDVATMKCWGGNTHGQLGIGDTDARGDNLDEMGGQLPETQIGGRAAFLAPGRDAVCVGLDSGQMRCWGNGEFGKLGQGDVLDHGVDHTNLPMVNLGSSSKMISASMYEHVCAIFEDRTIKCWGRNAKGQLGLGDTVNCGDQPNQMGTKLPSVDFGEDDTPLEAATGEDHTCVRFASQKVKCWGDNAEGQLGYGDDRPRGTTADTMGSSLPYLDLGR